MFVFKTPNQTPPQISKTETTNTRDTPPKRGQDWLDLRVQGRQAFEELQRISVVAARVQERELRDGEPDEPQVAL